MGGGSLSGSYSKSNIDADYASVKEQSGVVAGDGGYQVTVAEHTDLKGGIITSTQKAEAEGLNSFSTGTLSVSDVENHMHYEGDSFGISTTASYSFKDPKTQTGQTTTTDTPKAGQKEGRFGVNKSVGYGSEGESQTSITKSAINTSNIKVTDQKAQKATGISTEKIIAQVHTDTAIDTIEADSGALVNNFDAVEVQKELDVQTRVTQTFDTTRQEVKSYLNTKIDNANEIIEDKSGKYTKEQIAEAYQTVDDMQQLGVLVDSISGALYTPSDSALGTVANALAPEISYQIGQYFKKNEFLNDLDNGDRPEEGSAAHILAHAIVAGLVAEAAGNDALSAAISAGGSEALAPMLSKLLYGTDDTNKLDADQKETVSAILSLGSSALSSATGGSNTDIAASGMASSMAVEDNRQLHQAEITWINDNAKKFADQEGISLEEAKDRLAQQALRDVDAIWNIALGEDDAVAQTFIAENIGENDTFANTRGEQQVFFTTENGDFYDPSRYAVQSLQADTQLYQNAQQTAKEKTGELLSNPDKLKDAIEKKFDVNLNDVLEYANDKINANKDKNLEETTYDATLGRFQDTAKDGANYAETTLGIGETDKEIFDGIYGDGAGTIIKDIAPTAGIAAVILVNRKGAFQQAKRDANIPASQQPDMVYNQRTGQYQQYNSVLMKDRQGNIIKDENGNDIWTKEYQYTREDGSKIIIQDHSAGHQFGEEGIGDQGTHFNVRPVENTRTGNVPGTEEHYPFNN